MRLGQPNHPRSRHSLPARANTCQRAPNPANPRHHQQKAQNEPTPPSAMFTPARVSISSRSKYKTRRTNPPTFHSPYAAPQKPTPRHNPARRCKTKAPDIQKGPAMSQIQPRAAIPHSHFLRYSLRR